MERWPGFDRIQVGDVVARIEGSGGWGPPAIKRATVTKKTATQITIDSGERYTRRLERLGDGDMGSRAAHIEPWTEETDATLKEMREERRRQVVLTMLRSIDWRSIDQERRNAAWEALKELGIIEQQK